MQGVEGDAARDETGNGRQTKTASGSRTQKSNTSYSLNAANRGGSTSNEQFEENVLPQMGVARAHNMSGTSKRLGRLNN